MLALAGKKVIVVGLGRSGIAAARLCAARGASVTGLDVTQRMVQIASGKAAVPTPSASGAAAAPRFVVGDMMALPFASGRFDVVTTGYGLRNVPDLRTAIDEIRRVLKPGGRFLSLDFNRPPNAVVRSVYLSYLELVGGVLGWLLHRDPDTYRYIPASIRRYPGAAGVVRALQAQGFSQASFYPVLGGLLAIHDGIRD